MGKGILIVDDSLYTRVILREAFQAKQLKVIGEAKNGVEAIDFVYEHRPEIILLDIMLPDMLGLDILKTLKENGITSKFVMISSIGNEKTMAEAYACGACGYWVKPFDPVDLVNFVKGLV